MIQVSISEEVATVCPDLHLCVLSCKVANTDSDPRLWEEISRTEEELRVSGRLEEINKWLPIRATRQAYKRFGKDPNRYRPSSEALHRRILRGLPLYRINTLVDCINLISIRSGYSIGGFDPDKIHGDLVLGVGREGELYHGIGRGPLNIAGLPVYRDALGGIGTPTSDEERTKIDRNTRHLLMIINAYSGPVGLQEAGAYGADLLKRYVSATNLEAELISVKNRTELML